MILKNIKPKPKRYLAGIVDSKGFHMNWHRVESKKLIVIWHGALRKNKIDIAQPKVAVLLGELTQDGSEVTSTRYVLFFNVSLLGIIRIGTIWEVGSKGKAELLSAAHYTKKAFKVDCRPDSYEILSLKELECLLPSQNSIFPILGHRWGNYFENSKVIKFTSMTGLTVLVPCLEWFTRTYGVSASVRRVLMTEPFKDAKDKIFGIPEKSYVAPPSDWHISINKTLTIGDACFLAHLHHKESVRKRVDNIFHHIVTADNPDKMFIPIDPWNENVCKISTRGIMLNDQKTFLVLNVNGFENPDCPKIHLDKGSTYVELDDSQDPKPQPPPREENDGEGQSDFDGSEQNGFDEPEIEQGGKPGNTTNVRRVYDSEMEFFNEPKIKKVWTPRSVPPMGEHDPENEGTPKPEPGEELEQCSPSDPEGDNDKLGKIRLMTPPVIKGKGGVLRWMWVSFILFKNRHPKKIKSVEYFTFSNGFTVTGPYGDLKMVSFPDVDIKVDEEMHKWLRKPSTERIRGCFVIRIGVPSGFIYVLEIERTRHKTRDGEWVESNFKGLVFTLKDGVNFDSALSTILNSVLKNGGFFKKDITFEGLKRVDVFVHRRDKDNTKKAQDKDNTKKAQDKDNTKKAQDKDNTKKAQDKVNTKKARAYLGVVRNILKKMNINY